MGGTYIIAPGVVANSDGSYTPNTKPVTAQVYYGEYYKVENVETNLFDASFLKIREVRLEYVFTKNPVKFSIDRFVREKSFLFYGLPGIRSGNWGSEWWKYRAWC